MARGSDINRPGNVAGGGGANRAVDFDQSNLRRAQHYRDTLLLLCQLRLSAVERLHAGYNLSMNSHAHVLQVAVIPHYILDQLISCGTTPGDHPCWSNAVGKQTRGTDFKTIGKDC